MQDLWRAALYNVNFPEVQMFPNCLQPKEVQVSQPEVSKLFLYMLQIGTNCYDSWVLWMLSTDISRLKGMCLVQKLDEICDIDGTVMLHSSELNTQYSAP